MSNVKTIQMDVMVIFIMRICFMVVRAIIS